MCKIKKSSEAAYSIFRLKLSSKKYIKLTLTWQVPCSSCHSFLYFLSCAVSTKHLAFPAENKVLGNWRSLLHWLRTFISHRLSACISECADREINCSWKGSN